ncbi:divergent polysaccharide deacetylase family protein [Tabrizicola thermarum]|uniref:divergent polysaccharide deacetylase family protein n=1 Tax=Tabrizicola thermarum TaxID=2670345 RepID=UPI000FFBC9C9|nr:divergent polysaccharide deacetylase family protein [Tabrizicola thermarum]
MVGKFLLGMASGGLLVAGGLVIGSAVAPLTPANDPAPVRVAADGQITAPKPTTADAGAPVPAEATTTGTPAVEPAAGTAPQPDPEPQASAPLTEARPEPVAEAASVPQPDLAAAETAPPVPEPPAAEVGEAAAPAPDEVPAPEAAAAPAPLADTAADAPAAAPAAAAAPEPAAEPMADPVAPEAMADAAPEPAADGPAEPAPVVTPDPTPAPGSEPAPPALEAPAEPAPAPEPAPETAPEPAPPVADATPAPATPEPEAMGNGADLPGSVAEGMPGTADGTSPAARIETGKGSTLAPAPGLIGKDQGVVIRRGNTAEPAPVPEADPARAPLDPRPIAQFAASFENTEAKPPMAIVLIDPGTPDLDRAGLAALPFPVSFALDPLDPATPERAAIYRAAGHEVVMLVTGIADGAQPADVEVAFQSMEQGLPEAVAVMDLADPAFQNNRGLASAVVPILKAQGRGLLTRDEGLNAADQIARREDLEAATVFRDLDVAGGDKVALRRLLDRAVFKAGQDGRVSVVGTATPETVAALLEWTVEGKAATVALAPVTAVMKVD